MEKIGVSGTMTDLNGSIGHGSRRPRAAETEAIVPLTPVEVQSLKARMRDLQLAVSTYYADTGREAELGTSVRSFLTTAQNINEILSRQIQQAKIYNNLIAVDTNPNAQLVKAIKFARNVVEHLLHIVSPSNDVTLVGGALGFRIYANWDEVPAEVVDQLHMSTRRLAGPYTSALQGHEVLGTMMSTLRFFATVNPKIIHRNGRNEWTGFPLMSQPGMLNPLHPDEPSDQNEAREWMNSRIPGGDCRVVLGQVTIENSRIVFGQTFVGRRSYAPFFETVSQANFDIDLGYSYLEGNFALNFDDVSSHFPEAQQGPVYASRGEITSWTTPIDHLDDRADWSGPGVDAASWARLARFELEQARLGVMFDARRARRLNALVPPR